MLQFMCFIIASIILPHYPFLLLPLSLLALGWKLVENRLKVDNLKNNDIKFYLIMFIYFDGIFDQRVNGFIMTKLGRIL